MVWFLTTNGCIYDLKLKVQDRLESTNLVNCIRIDEPTRENRSKVKQIEFGPDKYFSFASNTMIRLFFPTLFPYPSFRGHNKIL